MVLVSCLKKGHENGTGLIGLQTWQSTNGSPVNRLIRHIMLIIKGSTNKLNGVAKNKTAKQQDPKCALYLLTYRVTRTIHWSLIKRNDQVDM